MTKEFRPQMGVYALCDPQTGRVMYVGQSVDTDYRFRTHCRTIHTNRKLSEWIGNLKHSGLEVEQRVLEECDSEGMLDAAEQKWIRHYKGKGEAELNISVGGASRSSSKLLNSHADDWLQLACKIRDARALLMEIKADSLGLCSTKHHDAMRDLVLKWERVVEKMEQEMRAKFPEWKAVSVALRSAIGRGT